MGPIAAALLAVLAPIVARLGSSALRIVVELLRRGSLDAVESAIRVGHAVVANLESTATLSGTQKHDEAFVRIASLLAAEGVAYTKRQVNTAIELILIELEAGRSRPSL